MTRKIWLLLLPGMLLLGVLVFASPQTASPAFASVMPTPTPPPIHPLPPGPTPAPTISYGSRGPAVSAWQHKLNMINSPDCSPYINLGSAVQEDGIYGPATANATSSFQQQTGLPIGGAVVDQATYSKMNSLLSRRTC